MTFWKWSRTASANATADSTCPFPEGMAPAAVNDGVRGLMAAAAKYRDDMSGAIITGGTSSAYTLTTNQGFTAPIADGTGLVFWAHATNAAGATLNVDGTGAVPFMAPINLPLPAGVLVAGTPYKLRYTTTPGWVLEGVFGQLYSVPIGGFLPFISAALIPNSSFVFPNGQAISRTTYATLFNMVGTYYGIGDGSTTFNIPDLRGRVIVGQDFLVNGTFANRVTTAGSGLNSQTTGAFGGTENKTLLRSDLPNVNATVAIDEHGGHAHNYNRANFAGGPADSAFAPVAKGEGGATTSTSLTGITATVNLNGNVNQTTINGLQPSIVLPMLLRVI